MYSEDWSVLLVVLLGIFAFFLFFFLVFPLALWGISLTQYPGNAVLMGEAKQLLNRRWDRPVAVVAIVFGIMILVGTVEQIITGTLASFGETSCGSIQGMLVGYTPVLTSSTLFWLLKLAVQGALALGSALFFLRFTRREPAEINDIFAPFARMNSFLYAAGTQLLISLLVFLWSLLFIIPGIVAACSYALSLYILADEPDLTPIEVLRKSRTLMKGHRLEYFWLTCRFTGWGFLATFTMGIGFLWLLPYFNVTTALFYERVREESC